MRCSSFCFCSHLKNINKKKKCISLLQIPIDLHDKEFLSILQEEPLPPLALVSFTEEEQVGALFISSHFIEKKKKNK